ncbi:MAG TPA: MBL fold metallo-hydrolase [Stellaceae bacterium]|nr:MBL fold metallo-hydrolase [Stellaceae bacterium]
MERVTIGAAEVTRIEESYEPNFAAAAFFPDWRAEAVAPHLAWMAPDHYHAESQWLKLSVHSWLIRIDGRLILIDTCVGNHKPRPLRPKWHLQERPWLARLAATGARPEDVDLVMCTHLHVDHVGWNTRLENGRWVPTFPNARYVFSTADYEHYLAVDRDPATAPANHGSFRDSVLPVVEAGLAQMVSGAAAIDEHLAVTPAPGHTPGTVTVSLASRGAEAIFCGDVVHHAIQVHFPDWCSFVCTDPPSARASRKRVLERCAGTGALLMPTHFGAPFVCRIDAARGAFVPRFGA